MPDPFKFLSQQGLFSQLALTVKQPRKIVDAVQGVRVGVAQVSPSSKCLSHQGLSSKLALTVKQYRKIVDGFQGVRVRVAQLMPPCIKCLCHQELGLSQLALGLEKHSKIIDGYQGVRVKVAHCLRLEEEQGPCPHRHQWAWSAEQL